MRMTFSESLFWPWIKSAADFFAVTPRALPSKRIMQAELGRDATAGAIGAVCCGRWLQRL
jgi:hypothetical protein